MARLSRIHFTRPLPLVAHTLRHPREDENPPHHPSFPRTREFRNENTTQTSQTHHSHTGLPQCHSREGENDGVFFSGIGGMERWIPAFAGMTDGVDLGCCFLFPCLQQEVSARLFELRVISPQVTPFLPLYHRPGTQLVIILLFQKFQ